MRSLIALSPIAELLSAVMLLSLPAMAEPPSQQTGQATRSSPGGTETRLETSAAALLGTPLESSASVNQNAEGLSIPNKGKDLNLQLSPATDYRSYSSDPFFSDQSESPGRIYLYDGSKP